MSAPSVLSTAYCYEHSSSAPIDSHRIRLGSIDISRPERPDDPRVYQLIGPSLAGSQCSAEILLSGRKVLIDSGVFDTIMRTRMTSISFSRNFKIETVDVKNRICHPSVVQRILDLDLANASQIFIMPESLVEWALTQGCDIKQFIEGLPFGIELCVPGSTSLEAEVRMRSVVLQKVCGETKASSRTTLIQSTSEHFFPTKLYSWAFSLDAIAICSSSAFINDFFPVLKMAGFDDLEFLTVASTAEQGMTPIEEHGIATTSHAAARSDVLWPKGLRGHSTSEGLGHSSLRFRRTSKGVILDTRMDLDGRKKLNWRDKLCIPLKIKINQLGDKIAVVRTRSFRVAARRSASMASNDLFDVPDSVSLDSSSIYSDLKIADEEETDAQETYKSSARADFISLPETPRSEKSVLNANTKDAVSWSVSIESALTPESIYRPFIYRLDDADSVKDLLSPVYTGCV